MTEDELQAIASELRLQACDSGFVKKGNKTDWLTEQVKKLLAEVKRLTPEISLF